MGIRTKQDHGFMYAIREDMRKQRYEWMHIQIWLRVQSKLFEYLPNSHPLVQPLTFNFFYSLWFISLLKDFKQEQTLTSLSKNQEHKENYFISAMTQKVHAYLHAS